MKFDPKLDLVLERHLDITPEQAWKGWTTPELMYKWFCPEPWKVIEAKVDPRPGGIFFTVMQSPEGETFPGEGCILEAIPNKKLVWTSTLLADYRPATLGKDDMAFTAEIYLESDNGGTKYTAIAKHGSVESKLDHEAMGFQEGWNICADQLVELMQNLK